MLKEPPPPLHEFPQCREAKNVHSARPRLVKHVDHHEAGLVVESRPVGVDEGLLQLLQIDVATAVRVHSVEPLERLLANTGRDVT